ADQLREAERRLIELAATIPQVDPAELKQLRDQHGGTLTFLAKQHEARGDFDAAGAAMREALAQMQVLFGEDHWTCRTAQVECERLQAVARLDPRVKQDIATADRA